MGTPEPKYDVFISYRWVEPDQTWVREQLEPALSQAGLKVCIDVRDFVPGRHAVLEMTRARESARHGICVLSPDYISGNSNLFEALGIRADDPDGSRSRLIPLLFRPTDIPTWIRDLILVDWTQAEARPREWRRLLDILGAPNRSIACPELPSSPDLPASAIAPREAVFANHSNLPG